METTPAPPPDGGAANSEKRTREQDADSEDEAIVHALLPVSSSSSSKAKLSTPAAAPKPKPRARSRASDAGPAKKKRRSFAPGTPTAWCHQDHQPHDLNEEVLLHCSNRKPIGKPKPDATEPGPTKPCTIKYCEKCLEKQCVSRPFPCPIPCMLTPPRSYDVNAREMVESGQAADWTCYVCRGECNCTSCRRKLLGETSTEVQSLSHPGGLFDKEPEVVDVAGGRSAAVRFSLRPDSHDQSDDSRSIAHPHRKRPRLA